MEILSIYRHEPDGSLSWVTSANSVGMARAIIHSADNPAEEFLIYDERTKEGITLRADGYWLPSKGRINSDSRETPHAE
jgi:hypothetical protein